MNTTFDLGNGLKVIESYKAIRPKDRVEKVPSYQI